jgi:hypothetical protein
LWESPSAEKWVESTGLALVWDWVCWKVVMKVVLMAVTTELSTAVYSAGQTVDWWDVLGAKTLAVYWADLKAFVMAALMAGHWAGCWDPYLVAHWADSWEMHLVAYWVV